MKAVYCRTCREVSLKSRFERDLCNVCGRPANPMAVRRPWQYYASAAVLLGAAGFLVVTDIPEFTIRLGIFAAAFVGSAGLGLWSTRDLRRDLRRRAEQDGINAEAGP